MTHLRANYAWRTRWASLALESLRVLDKKKNCHTTDTRKKLKGCLLRPVHSQFLLSVQDVREVRLSLQVPEINIQVYECKNAV